MNDIHPDFAGLGRPEDPARDGLYGAAANAINMATLIAFLMAIPLGVALWMWALH